MSTAAAGKEVVSKERKRRRPLKTEKSDATTTSAATASEATSVKKPRSAVVMSEQDKLKQAKAIFNYEENNVDKRDPKTDILLHHQASDELRSVLADIAELKNADSVDDGSENDLEQLRTHGTMQFMTLRKLNRMAHFQCKKARDLTNDAKQQIDQQNLRLQNLLYEVVHLQKEITKCFEFKSKDEDISLVPIEEFYTEAPGEISRPEVTKGDSHQQTLARLEWELEQRKRLSVKLAEAEQHKGVITGEIKTKSEYLESLQPKLDVILESTKPVQEYLGMPFDEIREQQMTAAYLPQPLYVLYMQASAYSESCDKKISITIQGDLEVAKCLDETAIDLDEGSESENEDSEKPREMRRRRTTTGDNHTMKTKQKILKKHPMYVRISIQCMDNSVLDLTFYYLLGLKVMTVEVKLTLSPSLKENLPISGGEVLSPDTLLSCLYPNDTGDDTPNAANNYALGRLGLGDFSQYIKEVGRPYHWAQWLCGLQFLCTSGNDPTVQMSQSSGHMETTIKKLRRRVKSRISMQKQLAAIERGQVVVSKEYHSLYPAKITARLANWKLSTHSDFVACSAVRARPQFADLATESAMFFVGVAERGSARLVVHAAISPDYPEVAPLFALCLKWGKEITGVDDDNIKRMEAEVNVHYTELVNDQSRDQLLTNQIERLLMCMDVYLESEPADDLRDGPREFSREKIFPRLARGPDRVKPFKFNPQLGFYSQR